MAAVIGSLERSLSGLGSTTKVKEEEDLPMPRGILDANIPTDNDPCFSRADKKVAAPRQRRNHSFSDSGIGSSISSEGIAPSFTEPVL